MVALLVSWTIIGRQQHRIDSDQFGISNVNLKLGGIGMPRLGFDWHTRARPIGSEELASSMAPVMSSCIEQFGPNRCMFESNFPVDKVSFSHPVLFNAFKLFSKSYSNPERAALFHDTAARAYRISEPG